MPAVAERTFSLPAEHADFIDAQVASGAYGSATEVVNAGLRALQERDGASERWLHGEVAATCDAMHADPSRALTAESVFDAVRAHHAARIERDA